MKNYAYIGFRHRPILNAVTKEYISTRHVPYIAFELIVVHIVYQRCEVRIVNFDENNMHIHT